MGEQELSEREKSRPVGVGASALSERAGCVCCPAVMQVEFAAPPAFIGLLLLFMALVLMFAGPRG